MIEIDDRHLVGQPCFTDHALERMRRRGIRRDQIAQVLDHGRHVNVRRADIFVVGRKEVRDCLNRGLQLSEVQGLHVVCASDSGAVITAYRNSDLRGLRSRRRIRASRSRLHDEAQTGFLEFVRQDHEVPSYTA